MSICWTEPTRDSSSNPQTPTPFKLPQLVITSSPKTRESYKNMLVFPTTKPPFSIAFAVTSAYAESNAQANDNARWKPTRQKVHNTHPCANR